ncbi:phage head spike fiber domain-containing protein [Aeromonas hydrophila]|uniref:phage head spike fiber domain-containing protein n=1 Tax=Aeromonas hydrophila TaxID=644 RepID=UPI002B46A56A|nr:hypothetical protein [Aeromonas hydrophila]
MAGLWYRVGTVTLTNGSKAVVGYGTKWKSANPLPGKGSMLCGPDGKVYEVDTVADDTNMTLVSNYTGPSGAGQGYALVLMALTIPQFSTQLSQFVQKNSLFASQINTLLTATGDVNLTDPDSGLVIKVPSWSKIASEGEGQAARAKVEAEKAAGSAALATDAVRDSAMPLPDVWLPLNDDLRMITGFGGDVKVGEITVAKRANFERVTGATYVDKSTGLRLDAAINAPRFEAPGLLIEKASTNLFTAYNFTGSNMTSNNVENAVLVKQTDPVMGGDYAQLKSVTAVAAGRYVWLPAAAATEGQPYTVTVTVRRPVGSPINRVRLGCNDMTPGSVYMDLIEGQAVDVVMSGALAAGKNTIKAFVWPHIGSDSAAAVPAGIALIDVGDIQVELGNVSTSRIRSGGAQTRREQDKVWLQELGNMLPLNRDFTLSFTAVVQYDLAEYGCFYAAGVFPVITRLLFWPSSTSVLRFYIGNAAFAGLSASQVATIIPPGVSRRITLIRRGSVSEMWIAGVKVVASSPTNETGFTNGQIVIGADDKFVRPMPRMHIRDFKVWHFAASDAQAKAIR